MNTPIGSTGSPADEARMYSVAAAAFSRAIRARTRNREEDSGRA